MKRLLFLLWLATSCAFADKPAEFGIYCLENIPSGRQQMENPALCEQRFSPCSTFKIPNALIGLEAGALKDENEVIAWDHKKREIEAWNADHSLKTAIPASAVPFFQVVARRLGKAPYRKFLKAFDYGNEDLSVAVDQFWLSSSLKISPKEQVAFLTRLDREALPIRPHWQQVVTNILLAKEAGGYQLYGKTGSGKLPDGRSLGWYVGLVRHGSQHFGFAAILLGQDATDKGDYPGMWTRRRAVRWLTAKGFLKSIAAW